MLKRCTAFFIALCMLSQPVFAMQLIRDAEIENTLRTYADPIFTAAGVKASSVHLFIVQEDVINAYVAGGANMFLYTGLIMACDTPDMLLGVMAHETGHIAGGHLAQGAEKLKNAQIGTILTFVLGAAAAVASRDGGAAAAVIGGGGTTVQRHLLAYSRSNEQAADQSAVTTLDKLGISTSGMLKTFELLERDARQYPSSPDPYMLTHPLTSDRIDFVRNHLQQSKIPDGQYPRAYTAMHARMVAKLYGFIQSPEHTLQKYPQSDKSVAGRMARAIAYYKMPDMDRAMKEMNSLIDESPKDPFFHELAGQMLFENSRVREALTQYQTAVSLLPNSPLILSDLANVEMAQDLPSLLPSAIAHLEKAVLLDNSNADTWRLLATAYGKADKLPLSYLALAEEALLEGDAKTARQRAEQALTIFKDDSPSRQRAQDIKTQAIEMKKEKDEDDSPF